MTRWIWRGDVSAASLKGRRLSKPLGRHLEALRLARRCSLYAIEERTGVAHARLRSYELGYSCPPLSILVRWALALGVQPGDLLPVLVPDA